MSGYVDVHCHLTHEAFEGVQAQDDVVDRARAAGLERMVVNGLEPTSNRDVLQLCSRHSDVLRAALGIYPLHAQANQINRAEFCEVLEGRTPPKPFDVAEELAFIESQAAAGELVAVGEAGLDGMYGYNAQLLDVQELVLRELCRIARRHRLPIIVHSRNAEERTFSVLQDEGVELADFHCFTGKKKLAQRIAAAGYYLSIPAVVTRNTQMQGYCKAVPLEQLLTETDTPFMAPDRVFPNEPKHVPAALDAMAAARGEPAEEVRAQIRANYETLFGR